jgi:hypothetical protein
MRSWERAHEKWLSTWGSSLRHEQLQASKALTELKIKLLKMIEHFLLNFYNEYNSKELKCQKLKKSI